ncbi:MAG: prephenate dehydratase [Rickettsiales bacterium]|nr:prephenate dehydratase [Rickettsiales bacterium]
MTNPANIIAFMGVEGANADLACRQAEPYMDTLALPTFEDVFDAVQDGRAKYGMIPIENSQAGRVTEIHQILPKTPLHIVAEHIQRVEHHLLAPKGATLESIHTVYSHPQALMQCRQFLRSHNKETAFHSNTATAAKDVAAWADPSKAAIASRLAAELYGLEILASNIEDDPHNSTVFIVLSQEPLDPAIGSGPMLTSLLFELRNIPAALYKALGGFATNGINMIKLESYIRGGGSTESQFFTTFEGNPNERSVQQALQELSFFSKKVKVLGVYPPDRKRAER